ncbi:MAG: tRNA (adenosine(37)-N6)-threonylcarbamoyltransferase complex ATPase subunit type 1 TsaE [Acidobacteria bacterium]|nr:tRNA (adenosine(37)-N6)-threonylcarbamoyltransferase complex ATPase subunit type 1 TsaE [Acidobacteriota bacterium]
MKSSGTKRRRRNETLISESSEETERIGLNLAREVPVPGVVLLRGELGTGKTTLTRGIARGLGLIDPTLVNSPSFTLVNIYQGNCAIYHVDLYRLQSERDLYSIGLDDFLGKEGVTVVEWSEKLPYSLGQAMEVGIVDGGGDRRALHIRYPPSGRVNRQKKDL